MVSRKLSNEELRTLVEKEESEAKELEERRELQKRLKIARASKNKDKLIHKVISETKSQIKELI